MKNTIISGAILFAALTSAFPSNQLKGRAVSADGTCGNLYGMC